MERIRHIRETDNFDNSERFEADPVRDPIHQIDKYDPASETHPEQLKVREYLDTIEEDVLKDIYAEYFRKSGAADASMNWIPLNRVRVLYKTPEEEALDRSPYGAESIASGVELYSHLLSHSPEQTLWTLIHEQCHAISQDRSRSYKTFDDKGEEDGRMTAAKSGVSQTSITTKLGGESEKVKLDVEINEGITELLTERIFREYKRRTGAEQYGENSIDPNKVESMSDWTVAEQKFGAYERYWQNAKMYIGILSAITDVPKEVVEESVIRTYIRNGEIAPFVIEPETDEVLAEVSPDLQNTLLVMLKSKKGKSPSLRGYVDYISRQDIPVEIKDKIIAALQEIKDEWGEAYKLAPYEV